MAWLVDTPVMMGWLHAGWQKNYSHTLRRNSRGGLWPSAVCRGAFYYPIDMKPGCRRTPRGTRKWLLHTWVCAILISEKFPNTVSQLLLEALSMQQQRCGKTHISIHPQKVQEQDQYLMKTGHLDKISYQDTELFKVQGY